MDPHGPNTFLCDKPKQMKEDTENLLKCLHAEELNTYICKHREPKKMKIDTHKYTELVPKVTVLAQSS